MKVLLEIFVINITTPPVVDVPSLTRFGVVEKISG
jgi:hypothetical protein